jgi:hypothetical protein
MVPRHPLFNIGGSGPDPTAALFYLLAAVGSVPEEREKIKIKRERVVKA